MFASLRQLARAAWLACLICIAMPAGDPLRADTASGASDADADRLTRMIRQLADRTADVEGGADTGSRAAAPAQPVDDAPTRIRSAPSAAPAADVAHRNRDDAGDPDADARADADADADADAGAGAASVDPNELRRLGPSAAGDGEDSGARFSYNGGGAWVMQTITALGIVIGLMLLLRWGWMRLAGAPAVRSTPVVEVLSRTAVAPRNHVLLLRVGQRILIVSDSSAGMQTLANVDNEQEVADLLAAISASRADSISGNFQQLLSRFGRSHDEADDPHHVAWSNEDGRDHSEHLFDRARDNVSDLASRIRNLSRRGGDA